MMNSISLAAALAIGLAGAGHCLGMCGGIAAAVGLGGRSTPGTTVAYHAGRISSYTLLGALLGLVAGSIQLAAWTLGLRYLAGFLLIAMGLYIADWWHGLTYLERAGAVLWRPVQRFSARWLPVTRARDAYALGLGWGLMPCGLIYSALAYALTAQNALHSASLMLAFGVGTLPAMLGASFAAGHVSGLLRSRGFKTVVAVLMIGAGLWTLYLTYAHGGHLLQRDITPDAAAPGAPSEMEHSHHG